MDALASHFDAGDRTPAQSQPVTWLSGEIVTCFNKVGPILWIAAVIGAFSGILLKTGHFLVSPDYRFLIAFMFVATVFMFWLSARIQRVGFAGRDLVISNYLRQERIPFDQRSRCGGITAAWSACGSALTLRSDTRSTTSRNGRRSSVFGSRPKRNCGNCWSQDRSSNAIAGFRPLRIPAVRSQSRHRRD